MNDPIISPWIFYIGYLAKMANVLVVIGVIIIWGSVVTYGKLSDDVDFKKGKYDRESMSVAKWEYEVQMNPEIEAYGRLLKNALESCELAKEELLASQQQLEEGIARGRKMVIAAIAIFVVWAVIPSETTIYRMAVARVVTPHNLQVTGETIENIVDKTVDKIIKIKEAQ